MKPEVRPARAKPRDNLAPALGATRQFGSRRGAEAQRAVHSKAIVSVICISSPPLQERWVNRAPHGSGHAGGMTDPSLGWGWGRAAKSTSEVFAAQPHPIPSSEGEGLRRTRSPQAPRKWFGAPAGHSRNPSAPPRLRANKIIFSRGAAEPRRSALDRSLIQNFSRKRLMPAMRNRNSPPENNSKFPANPCPAGNSHHARAARIARAAR